MKSLDSAGPGGVEVAKVRAIAYYSVSRTFGLFVGSSALAFGPLLPQVRDNTQIYSFLFEFPGIILLALSCLFFSSISVILFPKFLRAILGFPAIYLRDNYLINHNGFYGTKISLSNIGRCTEKGDDELVLDLSGGVSNTIDFGLVRDVEKAKESLHEMLRNIQKHDFY